MDNETIDLVSGDSDSDFDEIVKPPSPKQRKVQLHDFQVSPAPSCSSHSTFQNDPLHVLINEITSWLFENVSELSAQSPLIEAQIIYSQWDQYA